MKTRIFASYAYADEKQVQGLLQELQDPDLDLWLGRSFDEDPKAGGEPIDECDAFLLFVSANSAKSLFVQAELRVAFSKKKKIIPLQLESIAIPAEWEYPLAGVPWIRIEDPLWKVKLLAALHGQPGIWRSDHPGTKALPPKDQRRRGPAKSRSVTKSRTGKPPEKPRGDPSEEVSFTAFHPREGRVATWHTLLVYVHLSSALEAIRQDAARFEDQLQAPKAISSTSSSPIARGTRITIVPSCKGVTFNPPRRKVKWLEDFHRVDFRFRADPSLLDDAGKGQITFFVGPVIIGTLKFAMLFGSGTGEASLAEEDSAGMYHKDKIFISYSHKDTEIVKEFKKVHKATGYDVLIDIDNLRAGQKWNSELMHLIDCADIFQLFWSENSRKSKYCKQEWKHALARATEGFIRPIYWQKPLPKLPRELSKFHFEYVEL